MYTHSIVCYHPFPLPSPLEIQFSFSWVTHTSFTAAEKGNFSFSFAHDLPFCRHTDKPYSKRKIKSTRTELLWSPAIAGDLVPSSVSLWAVSPEHPCTNSALLGICATPRPVSAAFLQRVKAKHKCSQWEGSEFPHSSKKWFAGVGNLISQGDREGSQCFLTITQFSSFQEPAFMATSQTGPAEEQKLQPLKAPHPKKTPNITRLCLLSQPHVHLVRCTTPFVCTEGSAHPSSTNSHEHNPACANPGCFLKALDFLNLCHTTV